MTATARRDWLRPNLNRPLRILYAAVGMAMLLYGVMILITAPQAIGWLWLAVLIIGGILLLLAAMSGT